MAAGDPQEAALLDRAKMAVVAKLVGKAESTTYEPEAVALIERSYSLLAEILSDYDQAASNGAGRRRDRRLVRDRRRARREGAEGWARPVSADDGADRYRRIADSTDSTAGADPPGAAGGFRGTL